jgi:hypothetical protein
MKKYPYGLADFARMRRQGMFYADRTSLIPLIEEAGIQLAFLRPRRFGKSLLISMLANYYDVNMADEFDDLFGDLAIGENPTPRHNTYLVLQWDFSGVMSDPDPRVTQKNFFSYINSSISDFYDKYEGKFEPQEIDPDNAIISFLNLQISLNKCQYPLYVMIDEYDNFANSVAMNPETVDTSRYDDLVIGEGSLKTLFGALKSAVGRGKLDRLFITGVAPMVLSDISSGFITAENVSFHPYFADLCGFTEDEVRTELEQIVSRSPSTLDVDALLEQMRLLYNGYCFDPDRSDYRLYHPTLALFFLKYLSTRGKPPVQPLDSNLSMDAHKLSWFAQIMGGSQILDDLLNTEQPVTTAGMETQFRLRALLESQFSPDDMGALVTYFGMATPAGLTDYGALELRIPNTVTRSLYIDEIRQRVIPEVSRVDLQKVAIQVFQDGNIGPLCEYMEKHVLRMFDNRDYRHGEATVKTAFMTALFNDTQYLPISEAPLSRRYADAVFLLKPEFRSSTLKDILVEFKYLSLADLGMSGEELLALSAEDLHANPRVHEKLTQARQQRDNYANTLLAQYPKARLQAFTVLSLGFDRIIWEKAEGTRQA